jgi:hypothetical protein
VNLIRVFGSCIGVSTASSMMSWRMEKLVGPDRLDAWLGPPLLDAVEGSLVMLAVFALITAVASMVRPRPAS